VCASECQLLGRVLKLCAAGLLLPSHLRSLTPLSALLAGGVREAERAVMAQKANLPDMRDPKLWMLKCKDGAETEIMVRRRRWGCVGCGADVVGVWVKVGGGRDGDGWLRDAGRQLWGLVRV